VGVPVPLPTLGLLYIHISIIVNNKEGFRECIGKNISHERVHN
jgi:hypothetical protein